MVLVALECCAQQRFDKATLFTHFHDHGNFSTPVHTLSEACVSCGDALNVFAESRKQRLADLFLQVLSLRVWHAVGIMVSSLNG